MTSAGKAEALAGTRHGDLPDLNVWLALAVSEHPHHDAAKAYWHSIAAARVCFCRVTMLGLTRLLTQPKLMGEGALGLRAAFEAYRRFATLPEVDFCDEPVDCELPLDGLLTAELPARLCTDAYLAAFAIAGGLRLVSFDKDFGRFAGLDWLQLRADQRLAPVALKTPNLS
jgi:toxin-antitoxin system PIN domain toxin